MRIIFDLNGPVVTARIEAENGIVFLEETVAVRLVNGVTVWEAVRPHPFVDGGRALYRVKVEVDTSTMPTA